MSQEELNAPAYSGGDDPVVKVNGKKDGLQIMRFNKDYWDRSLPPSAIQFITMWYLPHDEAATQEFIRNNDGRPDYARLVMDELPLQELGGLIQKNEQSKKINEMPEKLYTKKFDRLFYSSLPPLSPTNHCSLFLNNTLKVVSEP